MVKTVRITFDMPEDATQAEVKEFIVDALGSWGGQFHPDDPLFGSLEIKTVVFERNK